MIVSCSKNDRTINNLTTQSTNQTEEGSSLFNNHAHTHKEDISSKIKAFRNLLAEVRRGTGAIFGETYVDDAVWNIEALLNASYARSDMHYQKTSQQKNQVSIVLNSNQKIVNSDLLTTFEDARISLANHYSSINSNDIQPLLIDVAVNNISGNTLTLDVTSVIAEDNNTENFSRY